MHRKIQNPLSGRRCVDLIDDFAILPRQIALPAKMDLQREELLSALRDAEEFISVTLPNETLSAGAQRRRLELEIKLTTLIKRSDIQEEDDQEFYDDVRENDIEPERVLKVEGVPTNESTEDTFPQENYEVMSSTAENPTEEIYDDTIPEEEPSNDEIYDDTIPDEETSKDEDTEVYEVAEPEKTDEIEAEETYDGVEENKSVNSLDIHDKSGTKELESLMKPIKPEDVDGVILTGLLDKHRKKGIYIGSKWQKRYCVLRSFALYYYSGVNATSQNGSIILPGYTVTPHKNNKKEFILTRGEDRSYVFMAKSKEDAEKWMEAIKKAASTTKISNRQSEILEQLRLSGEGEEDTVSINYDDVANGANNSPFETFDETYDDVGQQNESPHTNVDLEPGDAELYEAPDENPPERPPSLQPKPPASGIESSPPQPIRPSKPPPPPADLSMEDDQEMYDDVGPEAMPPPQPGKPSQPVSEIQPPDDDDEELYDDVGTSQPPPPPQPVRPNRPVSEIRPTTEEEEEELYDDVGIQGSEVQPVESKPPIPERHLPPVPSNDSRPSPPMPRIPLPPTPSEAPKPNIPPRNPPQESNSHLAQENKNAPPPTPPPEDKINKAPPPPPPEEETEEQEIDHNCIYQALWDCKPDAEDELEFCRGDLLYIYEKPHLDWWIGSRFKPQGYETLLIPTNFIMQAYDV